MPVIVVFTKFDLVVSQILLDTEGESSQHLGQARARAYTQYEQSCHSLFGREPKNIPAEIVSGE